MENINERNTKLKSKYNFKKFKKLKLRKKMPCKNC